MTTLTLKEQQQSISRGKKKPIKVPSKIVLCSPFEKYWPLLNAEDSSSIKTLISSTLISEQSKIKTSWRKLSKSPKLVQKQQTREHCQQFFPSEELLRQRKIVKIGLNAVSRAIQNLKLNSCILAGDVEHDAMLKPIISLAVIKNIPVIIMPNLRKITDEIIGFSCSALGIQLPDEKHSKYRLLNEAIVDVWKKFSVPSNVENRSRKIDDNANQEQVLYNVADKTQQVVTPNDIYLYRESNNVRSFQPPAIDCNIKEHRFSTAIDFISLQIDQNQRMYIPPSLKRKIKSNKNIKKRKVNE